MPFEREQLPEVKAVAAEHGYNTVVSSLLHPGWSGMVYNPPAEFADWMDPVVIIAVSDRAVGGEPDGT